MVGGSVLNSMLCAVIAMFLSFNKVFGQMMRLG